ncbi:MAG: hypothetical protein HZA47_03105 [Planctomycetes bacterium]|uniref:hypothetical protein n=1 Tax=Candidatus Wunengus sp. YC65 TaxID=3367701 RepID=UPI001E0E4D04|nr:hypothetical protein [Planctomycetota bacterium]
MTNFLKGFTFQTVSIRETPFRTKRRVQIMPKEPYIFDSHVRLKFFQKDVN